MPGFLLHEGATVLCAHTGEARPLVTTPNVRVGGQPAVVQSAIYAVSRCTLPSSAGGPCATAQWLSAATRVRAGGVPVLLEDSQAICAPTGTPLTVVSTQTRVRAT